MPLDYNQQKELQAKAMQTGQNVLQKVIIYSLEAVKFIANFIGDMLKQVMGK